MKKLKKLFSLVFALMLMLALCSCGAVETERGNEMKPKCEAMVEALLANDVDAAYAVFSKEIAKGNFEKSFPGIAKYIDGVETYELTQTGWYTGIENGVSYYKATYRMTTNKGNFTIEAMEVDGFEGLYGFHIVADAEYDNYTGTLTKMKGASPFQWGMIIFSALCFGFVIWMLADCIKRKIKYKMLWIFLILCAAFVITLNFNNKGVNFNAGAMIMILSYSYLKVYAAGAAVFKLTLPVGAIAYLIFRNKFTAMAAKEAAYAESDEPETIEVSSETEESGGEE